MLHRLPLAYFSAMLSGHEYYRFGASSTAVHPDNPLRPSRCSNFASAAWF
ncbi:MAG: hypothetical protein RLZZ230_109 [Candidatus Parcubacteria bacterium]